METGGQKLKRARERLKLRYRDVEEASQLIARRHENPDYAIALSRLADIENKGTVPTVFRLYSLCAIYRLDFGEVLSWYGVRTSQLPVELPGPGSPATHVVWASPENGAATARVTESDLSLEPGSTSFLGHLQRWGGCSIPTLDGANGRNYRYGYIGLNDWSMYPVLQPGSLVAIDDRHRKIASGGWNHEFDRPIYFLEHRDGFACNWCTLAGGNLIVLSHPASQVPPVVYRYPNDIEVVGQVAGIAMLLNSRKPHGPHWRAAQAASPGR